MIHITVNGPKSIFLYVSKILRITISTLAGKVKIINTRKLLKKLLLLHYIIPHEFSITFASHLKQNGQPVMPIDLYFSKFIVYFCMWFHHHDHVCVQQTRGLHKYSYSCSIL